MLRDYPGYEVNYNFQDTVINFGTRHAQTVTHKQNS